MIMYILLKWPIDFMILISGEKEAIKKIKMLKNYRFKFNSNNN